VSIPEATRSVSDTNRGSAKPHRGTPTGYPDGTGRKHRGGVPAGTPPLPWKRTRKALPVDGARAGAGYVPGRFTAAVLVPAMAGRMGVARTPTLIDCYEANGPADTRPYCLQWLASPTPALPRENRTAEETRRVGMGFARASESVFPALQASRPGPKGCADGAPTSQTKRGFRKEGACSPLASPPPPRGREIERKKGRPAGRPSSCRPLRPTASPGRSAPPPVSGRPARAASCSSRAPFRPGSACR
jgi:hypothetical protein